jgi:hypothetical protein
LDQNLKLNTIHFEQREKSKMYFNDKAHNGHTLSASGKQLALGPPIDFTWNLCQTALKSLADRQRQGRTMISHVNDWISPTQLEISEI